MDSSRPVLLNEFYRGGKLVEQTSDTAASLRGTADPHCLCTRGPAPFILRCHVGNYQLNQQWCVKIHILGHKHRPLCAMHLLHQILGARLSKESGKGGRWDQEHAGVSHPGLLCRRPPLYLLRSCKTRLPLGRVSWRRQQLRPESAVLRASQAPSTALPVQAAPAHSLNPP